MNKYWKLKYFEKNIHESHINIFRSLEIENYLKQLLKRKNYEYHSHKLCFANSTLILVLFIYKKKRIIGVEKKKTFWKSVLKSLNRFTNNKFNITLKVKKVRAIISAKELPCSIPNCSNMAQEWRHINFKDNIKHKNQKQTSYNSNGLHQIPVCSAHKFVTSDTAAASPNLSLQNFKRPRLKKLYSTLSKHIYSARLLGVFIADQLKTSKQHNFFLNTLTRNLTLIMQQKNSRIKGIKIIIKGRLNNAPRSRNRIIKNGKISLQTYNKNMDYAESTAFTPNGTIGIKIWINYHKIK